MKLSSHILIISGQEGLVFRLDETRVDYNNQKIHLARSIRKGRFDSSQTNRNWLIIRLRRIGKARFYS
jgi:hypothetical protein